MDNNMDHNETKPKPNPEDRSDNVEKIQDNIDHTIHNIELAEEMIVNTSDEKMKEDLQAKNERREEALDGMRKEIKDEADAREESQGYAE